MQIFKCLIFNAKKKLKKAQNLIEFVYILPMLVLLTLIMFEVGLYWQDVNGIYNLNAEINANLALIEPTGLSLGDTCPAATRAFDILQKRDSMISLNNPSYSTIVLDGQEPFALYYFHGGNNITDSEGYTKPQIQMWVDCRNPFEEGYTNWIEFYHKTLLIKATIPRYDKPEGIEIIPENIFIASPKVNSLRHY